MSHKVVIEQELLEAFSFLAAAREQLGVEFLPVSGGREALEQITAIKPSAVVVPLAMSQVSGVEVCRRIRSDIAFQDTTLILISDVESSSLKDRALAAGCDVFLPLDQAADKLVDQLRMVLGSSLPAASGGAGVEQFLGRRARRVEVQSSIECEVDHDRLNANLMNVSRNGVLFSVNRVLEISKEVRLHFSSELGERFDLGATVVRVVELKDPVQGFYFAAGATFSDLDGEGLEGLSKLLGSKEITDRRKTLARTDFVRRMLEQDVEVFGHSVRNGDEQDELLPFLGEILPAEETSFRSDDSRSTCIQRLVALRAQCLLFFEYVPVLAKDKGALAPTFLPMLGALLDRCDASEQETEELVKQAVSADDEDGRQDLNRISNRLHGIKMRLLFEVAENVSAEGLGPEGDLLESVNARVAHLRELRNAEAAEATKYGRRLPPPKPKAPKASLTDFRMGRKVWIPLVVAVSVFGAGLAVNLIGATVSSNDLQLPLAFEKAWVEERSLAIRTTKNAWGALDEEEKALTMEGVEAYLRTEKLMQAKLVDQEGAMLAALLSSGGGRTLKFRARYFAE